jgi:hypothetical protein
MPWDPVWSYIQSLAPSFEMLGVFLAIVASIFVVQRLAGVRWTVRSVVRDLALVTLMGILALIVIGQEPDHHFMQRTATWLENFK